MAASQVVAIMAKMADTMKAMGEMRPKLIGPPAFMPYEDGKRNEEEIIKLMLVVRFHERCIAWILGVGIPVSVIAVMHLILCK